MLAKNKILILLLAVCILFSISTVVAGDLNESDTISHNQQIEGADENLHVVNTTAGENEDVLNTTYSEKTLTKDDSDKSVLSENYADVYINSITTRYNSGKYLNFGWSGVFDGHFKVYKSKSLIYDEYLYGTNEKYTWSLEGLSSGTYTAVLITYNGITLGSANIVIKKSSSKISVNSFKATAGSKFYCYAYVKDKYTSRNYNGGTVKFKINGKTYSAKLKNGVAVAKIRIPNKIKKFTCTAKFSGGNNVYGSSTKFKMTVKKKPAYKTVNIKTKMSQSKYVTKYYGKYKIQTFKFKHAITTLCVFLYKNGKMLNKEKYLSKVQYNSGGKWRWTGWMHGTNAAVYHKYEISNSIKIGNVKVKFKV